MLSIENEQLKVTISSTGAELSSLYYKKANLEYMWSGDPAFWGKKSPVLFPIIGSIKEDTFYFDNKAYHLPRHGFAREMEFSVTEQTHSAVVFTLVSSEITLQKFPFAFRFDILYRIEEEKLSVTYKIANTGYKPMYFSAGGHPAFKLPLADNLDYTDYRLVFNQAENTGRWPISTDGLIEPASIPLFENTNILPLAKELFLTDAIVLKHLRSNKVRLESGKSPHGFEFDFTGFPYLGIWAAKKADFVCIEPWCGIADSVNSNQQLTDKEGINELAAQSHFERTWSITVF